MDVTAKASQTKRSGCGCLGIGCLVASIIATVVVALLGWFLVHSIRGAVEGYTVDTPSQVPMPEVDEAIRRAVGEKIADLREVLTSRGGQGSFSFSAQELQAAAQVAGFGPKVALDANGEAVRAQFSFALADFANPAIDLLLSKALSGRYFNGSAVAKLSMKGGHLEVRFESLNLNNREISGDALGQAGWFVSGAIESYIASLAAAGGAETSSQADRDTPSRINAVSVRDGVLRVEIKPL